MTENTEARDVAILAQQAAQPTMLTPGEVYAVADGAGGVGVVSTDAFAETPRHKAASHVVLDTESLATYLSKHGDAERTELWADEESSRVVAIVDGHQGDGNEPGWEKHRVTLQLTPTPSWLQWCAIDGKFLSQQEFAEFIELRAPDVEHPSSAELITLARHIEATKSVDFKSGERDSDGQVTLRYEETIKAKAGQKGELSIPERITLGLRPYRGGPGYRVFARFRYRIQGDNLLLGVVLDRKEQILEQAFEDVVGELKNGRIEGTVAGDPFPPVGFPIHFGRF